MWHFQIGDRSFQDLATQLSRPEWLYATKESEEASYSKHVEYQSSGRYGANAFRRTTDYSECEIAAEREHCQMEMAHWEKAVQVQMQQIQEHMQALINVAATKQRVLVNWEITW